jgi:uncharacterized protein (TIGR03083 family)
VSDSKAVSRGQALGHGGAHHADVVRAAFRAEAGRLSVVLHELSPPDWSRPTPCPPWTVAELLGHILTTIAWLPGMLAAPAPAAATVSAAGYYRPDQRFSAQANAERVALGRRRAGSAGDGPGLAAEFGRTWRHVLRQCEPEPPERVVRTRHGDAMLLSDFLLTRVVEVGVHGLDLASALGRPPWLTRAAAGLLGDLLFTGAGRRAKHDLGWDPLTAVRKATGRLGMTSAEVRYLSDHRISVLALG